MLLCCTAQHGQGRSGAGVAVPGSAALRVRVTPGREQSLPVLRAGHGDKEAIAMAEFPPL